MGELNLANEDPGAGTPRTPELEAYDPKKAHDDVRKYVTFVLLGVLALVLICIFVSAWIHTCIGVEFEVIEKVATLVFTPVVALVGTAVGFYFGGQKA